MIFSLFLTSEAITMIQAQEGRNGQCTYYLDFSKRQNLTCSVSPQECITERERASNSVFYMNFPPLLRIELVLCMTGNTYFRSMAASALFLLKVHLSKADYSGCLDTLQDVEQFLRSCYPSLELSRVEASNVEPGGETKWTEV